MFSTVALCVLAVSPLRVAVLPFQNDTTNPEYAVLRQGLADLVLTDLVGTEGVEVVERGRFQEVLAELKLQQTKAFDSAQTVKLGRLLGATHVIAGTLVAAAPKVKLSVRLVDLAKGSAVVSASVDGPPTDLFDLEQRLVEKLVVGLHAKFSGVKAGHTSLSGLVSYSQGMALADNGQLDEAKSKLAEAVRLSPDFTLAQERYADVLAKLRAAQRNRGSTLDEVTRTLTARLTTQLGKPPVERALGARIALMNLTLLQLGRLVGAQPDTARFIDSDKRVAVEALEATFVSHASALVQELRPVRSKHAQPTLDDEDDALGERTFDLHLAEWRFATPSSIAESLGAFLGSGWTPYDSDMKQFAVRPSPAQRSPAQLKAARAWFDVARTELPLDKPELADRYDLATSIANDHAEMLVLLGRPKEAVAQWQGFLDEYPTAPAFTQLSQKLTAVLLLDDDAERDEQQLARCDQTLLTRGAALANRTWRAKGSAGLLKLNAALLACAAKAPEFAAAAWALPGAELRRVADCDSYAAFKVDAAKHGQALPNCQ